jgi:hypothetical protein
MDSFRENGVEKNFNHRNIAKERENENRKTKKNEKKSLRLVFSFEPE